MAIFEEQVLEPFVAKGIGNSGVASRQIQAGNLPDLSAAVRQSVMTQQNLKDQKSATLKALAIKNYRAPSLRMAVADNSIPFDARNVGAVIETSPNGTFRLKARVGSNSLLDQSFSSLKEIQDYIASNPYLKNTNVAYSGGSGIVQSDLGKLKEIGTMVSPIQIQEILNNIRGGAGSSGGMKWSDPTYPERKAAEEAAKAEAKARGESWRAAETQYTSDAQARENERKAAAIKPVNPVNLSAMIKQNPLGANLGLGSLAANLTRNLLRRRG